MHERNIDEQVQFAYRVSRLRTEHQRYRQGFHAGRRLHQLGRLEQSRRTLPAGRIVEQQS